jgi:peptide deformylase
MLLSLNLYAHTIHYYPNAPLEIITIGHPTLTQVAKEVPFQDIQTERIQNLIEDMFVTMEKAGGVGLAAPQVNVSERLFVMKPSMMKSAEAIINPTVDYIQSAGMKKSREGCLSIPGKTYTVKRYRKLNATYFNRYGEQVSEQMKGFRAIVFQHEYDHLNGDLISNFLLPLEYSEVSFEEEGVPKM